MAGGAAVPLSPPPVRRANGAIAQLSSLPRASGGLTIADYNNQCHALNAQSSVKKKGGMSRMH